ncbi:hypothetical protein ScPMuIL_010969 [Solemya velum]
MFLILVLFTGAVAQTANPACSFTNGQCVYSVQLGHRQQCDSAPTASTGVSGGLSGECSCHDVQTVRADLNSLSTMVTELQTQVSNLGTGVSHTDMAAKEAELQAAQQQKVNLLMSLGNKESLLNQTKLQLASEAEAAATEIQNLRTQLGAVQRELATCQARLGVTHPTTSPNLGSGKVNLTLCDFESSCGYSSSTYWVNTRGAPSMSTGPRADRTFGTTEGHYLRMDSHSLASTYQRTHFISVQSPEFEPAPAYCIQFAYNMFGSDVKNFSVYAKIGSGRGYPIFSRFGPQGSEWLIGQVDLTSEYTARPFTLVFEGSTDAYYHHSGSTYVTHGYSDIAIDDIYAYNTSCSRVPDCPDGAHRRTVGATTTCYTFHTTGMTWSEAEKTCRNEGIKSHLVAVNDRMEQDYLVQIIKSDIGLTAVGTSGWYTVGNDITRETEFSWTESGTPVRLTFTNWHQGQPNDVGGRQDCLLMQYQDANYEWGDVDCDTRHPFICEKNI